MAGGRQLGRRCEDADAVAGADIHGLAEPDLLRELLLELVRDGIAVEEHGELIASERDVGEDVSDDVVVRAGHEGRRSRLWRKSPMTSSACSSPTDTRIIPSPMPIAARSPGVNVAAVIVGGCTT